MECAGDLGTISAFVRIDIETDNLSVANDLHEVTRRDGLQAHKSCNHPYPPVNS